MDLGLTDKLILITGGASGIGEATARLALAEGARVAAVGRSGVHEQAFADEMHHTGAAFDFVTTELADPLHCRQAVETILSRHGSIDAVVNNAAVNDGVSLHDGSPEAFMRSIENNLLHVYAIAHYALPALKKSRGSIVNIASKVALTGQGGTSGYAAAKGGVLGLTREWAADLLPFGIRVNAIVPAEVMTPAYTTWLDTLPDKDERLRRITERIPLGHRMTTPAEIASAILFLLSPTHSSHTTGQIVHPDGGYVHLDRALI